MLAHNLLYTFIAPFLARAGLAGDVGTVLLLFGLCALLGVWTAGRLVDGDSGSTFSPASGPLPSSPWSSSRAGAGRRRS